MNKLGKVIALVLILGMLQLCESSLGREMVVGKNIEEGALKGLKVEEAKQEEPVDNGDENPPQEANNDNANNSGENANENTNENTNEGNNENNDEGNNNENNNEENNNEDNNNENNDDDDDDNNCDDSEFCDNSIEQNNCCNRNEDCCNADADQDCCDDNQDSDCCDDYGTDYNGQGSNSTLAVIFGVTIGVIVLLVFVSLCIWQMCRKKSNKVMSASAKQKGQGDLTQRFMVTDDGSVNPSLLEEHLEKFLELLEQVKLELKFCIFIQKGKSRKMKITEIKAERLNKVSYTVKLSGSDGLGRWTGDGVFTIKDGVPFFWMLKKYAEKKRAGQTGKYKDLVFMSESISQSRLNGEWYYDGFEYSTTHSGTWSIDADAAPEMKFDL